MAETKMPAAEAVVTDAERNSYEFAFHILPTVAEGEVQGVFDALKTIITDHTGELFDEEAPDRFELAYEIVQAVEGKNRKFASTYFGWVRFTAPSPAIAEMTEEIETRGDILRYLMLKLTKTEVEHPFRFHEALKDEKMVTNVEETKATPEAAVAEKAEPTEAVVEEKSETATDAPAEAK